MTYAAQQAKQRGTEQDKHRNLDWAKYAATICGVWLASNVVLSQTISKPILINNIVCGVLVAVLSLLSLAPKRDWLRWLVGAVGAWLLFAPLIFWAPSAFHYDGSTFIGAMIITFSFLIPGQPGALVGSGPNIPPGWSYNPSSWEQRGPIIAIALFGFFFARYLAAYQLGYINSAWDPFFGNGTETVLSSEISRAFIISDAGLGAISYLVDALEGFLGGQNRWRTMPWAVILFAASIIPAGVTSIVLIMLQPIGVGAWCSICLLIAVAMLIMVPYSLDELIATSQFLLRAKRRGEPFWKTVLYGGSDEPEQATAQSTADGRGGGTLNRGFAGVNFPPTLIASTFIGIWVMSSPAILGITGSASDSQHLTGALIVTVAFTAMAEACRSVRFLNVVCAIWLMGSLIWLSGFPTGLMWTNLLVGVALVILSLPKGAIKERYGSFDKFIF